MNKIGLFIQKSKTEIFNKFIWYSHQYTSTRSTPHKGTAKADITLKLNTELTYRGEHFCVGFPIFASICIQKKKYI